MLGSRSRVHVGSGKNLCAVTMGGFDCAGSPELLCLAVLPQEQRTGETAGVAQDQTGNFAQTGTEWRPLELQLSTWNWIITDLMLGFC